MQFILFQILYIQLNNLLNATNNNRIKIIAIERKALADTTIIWWKLCPKPIQCDLVVIVKVLKHTDDFPDTLNVRIGAIDNVMQTGAILCVGVTKINS